jgi:hypothetical protein
VYFDTPRVSMFAADLSCAVGNKGLKCDDETIKASMKNVREYVATARYKVLNFELANNITIYDYISRQADYASLFSAVNASNPTSDNVKRYCILVTKPLINVGMSQFDSELALDAISAITLPATAHGAILNECAYKLKSLKQQSKRKSETENKPA